MAIAPYTEADLQRQVDQLTSSTATRASRSSSDVNDYVARRQRLHPRGEGQPDQDARSSTPRSTAAGAGSAGRATDLVATASLVGGIFGKGGGRELDAALMLQECGVHRALRADDRGPRRAGPRGLRRLPPRRGRGGADHGARQRFPYQRPPGDSSERSPRASPDPDSPVTKTETSVVETRWSRAGVRPQSGGPPCANLGGAAAPAGRAAGASNALLVSGPRRDSGNPQTVFGPQTALLLAADPHGAGRARARARRARRLVPRREPLRAARPRPRLRVERDLGRPGHHRHVRGRAVRPGGARDARVPHYLYRGECEPIEVLEHTNGSTPTRRDPTPAGAQTLARPAHQARPIVSAAGRSRASRSSTRSLRSTYFHEIDSARGFSDFNDPEKMRPRRLPARGAQDRLHVQLVLHRRPRRSRYFNSGEQPGRAPRSSTQLPASAAESTSGAAMTPTTTPRATRRSAKHPRRPTTRDSSRAGTTSRPPATARRDDEPLLVGLSLAAARRPHRGADRRRAARCSSTSSSTRWRRPRPSTCAATRCCPGARA